MGAELFTAIWHHEMQSRGWNKVMGIISVLASIGLCPRPAMATIRNGDGQGWDRELERCLRDAFVLAVVPGLRWPGRW